MSDRQSELHDRICRAEMCTETIRAKGRADGFCSIHYQEQLKTRQSPVGTISRDGSCLVDGCDTPRRSRGLCGLHYDRGRRLATCPVCNGTMKSTSGLCVACRQAAIAAEMPTEKKCNRCNLTLPMGAFALRKVRQGAAKWRSRCKQCEAIDSRLRAKTAVIQDRSKERRTAPYLTLRSYAKRLGISWAEVVERYPADNRCEICGRTPEEANSGGRYVRLSLDHCHETGRLRGFLCGPCNSGVGYLGDAPERLRLALKYLTKENRPRSAPAHHVDQDPLPGT